MTEGENFLQVRSCFQQTRGFYPMKKAGGDFWDLNTKLSWQALKGIKRAIILLNKRGWRLKTFIMFSSFFPLSSRLYISDWKEENILFQTKFQKGYDRKYSWAVLEGFSLSGHATGQIKVNKVRSDWTVHVPG